MACENRTANKCNYDNELPEDEAEKLKREAFESSDDIERQSLICIFHYASRCVNIKENKNSKNE
jgi:hypothetical protein